MLWLTTDDCDCEMKYPLFGKYGYVTINGFITAPLKYPPVVPMKTPRVAGVPGLNLSPFFRPPKNKQAW
jgi:hypothetical protein